MSHRTIRKSGKILTFKDVANEIFDRAKADLDLRELPASADPVDDDIFWDILLDVCNSFVAPFLEAEVVTVKDVQDYGTAGESVWDATHMYLVDNVTGLVRQLVQEYNEEPY